MRVLIFRFAELLARKVQAISPGTMLTPGIRKVILLSLTQAYAVAPYDYSLLNLQQFFASLSEYEGVPGVNTVTDARNPDPAANEAAGIVLTTDLQTFLSNHAVCQPIMQIITHLLTYLLT